MAKTKRKLDAKTFAQQRRKRRQWLTFVRMCRYGVNNFSRNAWLTVAATAVMTVTLLVIFMSLAAFNVLNDTVASIRNKVDMSLYVKSDTSDEAAGIIRHDIEKLPGVRQVVYVSSDQARKVFAQENQNNSTTLNALNQAAGGLPGTFKVNLIDLNNTSDLKQFTETNQAYKDHADASHPPSFAGDRKMAIESIGRWVKFAVELGVIASVVFIGISFLIVFNTIRMAIFNRKDEIQMMKLIGADKNFIRGPFLVEAIVYGFIAAIVATVGGVAIMYTFEDKLQSYGLAVLHTMDYVTVYIGFVVLGMIVLGAIIGVLSSLMATRKYLKISL